ncbi:hypothetical protein SAMD00019534_051850 [Acytostelium subglobosum LB1]|uniref:hypothetical protein n=1 Tax=Acytostelium subglobosum LB1 TaxID=1410327 RepID=UPI000645150C|nr:hypothetical protein SAMD00019534_051850 [Acytostelium subglobosum LB1]GAM22010.1 hypothetical protein SAMD00019534_051850 [Acytostelium subglobosum LB1]|eukprot:XP_012755110.1 hypothetical protein SAMD00019534_051850 [Acytostelium subglobosum LB1]
MLLFIVYLLTKRPFKPRHTDALSKAEEEELLREWRPIPLAPKLTPMMIRNSKNNITITEASNATHVTVNGQENVLNLARSNYLGFIGNSEIQADAEKTIRKYGVGACGPRGFYGTIDVHLDLEKRLGEFLKYPCPAILYSSGYATVSTTIPSFSKIGDIIIADKCISQPIQVGLALSRSRLHYFNHNDIKDLTRVLEQTQTHGEKGKITRKFVVLEGIYYNTGDLCILPQIMALKDKYKFRIIIDESHSIGVLGKTGRGITEHFGINQNDIEITTASLANSFSSGGGFCVGDEKVVTHQRLNCVGYVFSASLPPFLATSATKAIDLLERDPALLTKLSNNIEFIFKQLQDINGLQLFGSPLSPVLHLRVQATHSTGNRDQDEDLLEQIVVESLNKGLLITRAKYVDTEKFLPEPSIRLCVNAALTQDHMRFAASTIKEVASKVFTK